MPRRLARSCPARVLAPAAARPSRCAPPSISTGELYGGYLASRSQESRATCRTCSPPELGKRRAGRRRRARLSLARCARADLGLDTRSRRPGHTHLVEKMGTPPWPGASFPRRPIGAPRRVRRVRAQLGYRAAWLRPHRGARKTRECATRERSVKHAVPKLTTQRAAVRAWRRSLVDRGGGGGGGAGSCHQLAQAMHM